MQDSAKFNTALEFLERVKTAYQNQQHVYNRFLDIMKDFKNHTIDTPGVIQRVKQLFRGHPELIEGFNTFLPPGYKIDPEEDDEAGEQHAPPAGTHPAHIPAPQHPVVQPNIAVSPPAVNVAAPPRRAAAAAASQTIAQVQAQDAMQIDPHLEPRRQPEFDNARNYVKKIKTRFSNQPYVYKQFLEILHSFHREQHSIADVYSQVSKLFKDHPDLLAEFSQFLPSDPNVMPAGAPSGGVSAPVAPTSPDESSQAGRGINTRAQKSRPLPSEGPRSRQRGRADDRKEGSFGTYEEIQFFSRIKHALCGGWNQMSQAWEEFLKCLALYNQDIISRNELYLLIKELLRPHDPELTVWFRNFLGVEDSEPTELGLNELDWSSAPKLGPSYRELPERLRAQLKCSGRQEDSMYSEVLNDKWVSVPTGSEDGTFKNSRKNQYEELLFKCEDDRFELDMLIESTSGAIRFLEDLLASIKSLPPDEQATYRLREEELDVLHTRTVKRVYGHRGDDIIKLIELQPTKAIPIVVNRLKQKYIEWGTARRDWGKIWRAISKSNYAKALDHQSVAFKQEEKKTLNPKNLLQELKTKASNDKRDGACTTAFDTSQPHLEYQFTDPTAWGDVKRLLLQVFELGLVKGEKSKFETWYNDFLGQFFNFKCDTTSADVEQKSEPQREDAGAKVKPINTQSVVSAPTSGVRRNVFLGNDSLYILFRYLQLLLDRLKLAREFARQPAPSHWGTPPEEAVRAILGETSEESKRDATASGPATVVKEEPSNTTDVVMTEADGSKPADASTTPAAPALNDDATTNKRYNEFLSKVDYLLSTSDISTFEDELRENFGLNCFPLFTVDRLVILLAKQINYAITDDVCEQLFDLFEYEKQRLNAFSDTTYFNNTCELLQEDKRIFKFSFDPSTGQFGITEILLKNTQTPTRSRPQSPPRSPDGLSVNNHSPVGHVDEHGASLNTDTMQYVNALVSSSSPITTKPFLKRNVAIIKKKGARSKVFVDNGLQLIIVEGHKRRFVESSEDLFLFLDRISDRKKIERTIHEVIAKLGHV